MKGSPSYPENIPSQWKVELLRWLGKTTGIKTLIETGTCHGFTCWSLHDDFDKILTIELHNGLYEQARKRLSEFPNVRQYHGSSRNLLSDMIKTVGEKTPILFWLDAHGSGPNTADDGDPLSDEVKTIQLFAFKPLMVIDDLKDAELKHVIEAGVNLDGWHREYRTGEVVMHHIGHYNIPPFEDGIYVDNGPVTW
jgi:hypothetical protein